MTTKPVRLVIMINLLLLTIQGCKSNIVMEATPVKEIFEIDPVFREVYDFLGGEEILGKAISRVYFQDNSKSQYLTNGKIVYNPQASSSQFFQMAPIGRMFGSSNPDSISENLEDELISGVHSVHPEFATLYKKIGSFFVGKPITGLKYNPNRKRFEQHFENLGIYRLEGESPGNAHLLAYGMWACESHCMEKESSDATVDFYQHIENPFNKFVKEFGLDFTGFPLTAAYSISDGKKEQIFENIVLATENRNNSAIEIRPLPKLVNIISDAPAETSDDASSVFFPVDDKYGYNIPIEFWEFITQNGGIEVFGAPITHYTLVQGEEYRQCFTNICLLSNINADPETPIKLEPLGYIYKEMNYRIDR